MTALIDVSRGVTLPPRPTPTFPFQVGRRVGEGAMGEVYYAEDLELGRPVAIKVIRPTFLAALSEDQAHDAARRFLQEARAAAALTHPGATTVHRVGTEHGRPYIAMEWIEGRPLDAVLRQDGPLPVEEAVRVAVQVLDVLAAAHEAGIVHRDVKPGNLMLTRDGRVKVTDFGIARVQGSDLARTQAGTVLGTPHYAAPEQLAGRSVDCRADLYAAGAVLYETLVGQPPFDGATLYEVIRQAVLSEPVHPSDRAPRVPRALGDAVLRALAKQPDDRFPDARSMARALQPWIAAPAPTADTVLSGSEPMPVTDPTLFVAGASAGAIVAALVRSWPGTSLGAMPPGRLLARLHERPLHAEAFCGGVEVGGATLLVFDGVLHAALDPTTGASGDAVLESLPDPATARLCPLPAGLDPRLIPLLAAAASPRPPRLTGLDPAFASLPHLAARLASEGFDGVLRFEGEGRTGFALFSRGARVLDVFGEGWAEDSGAGWEQWIRSSGALASVEDLAPQFPACTYRQQLRDVALDVVRPQAAASGLREDARAEAQALTLRPREAAGARRPGDTTFAALLDGDPAAALARWALVDLAPQFQQHGRTARWRALVEPLDTVREVRLHHGLPVPGGAVEVFDAVTIGEDGQVCHVLDRVARATPEAVDHFVRRALAAKAGAAGAGLSGAILVAPRFDDDALEGYLRALRPASRATLLRTFDAFTHREGFIRTGARAGMHVLLVEEDGERRRPLVPS
ncbi:MAG: hypothetical protein AMXMBFR64_01700 [Myxococcales bacterium]